jgi:hypothetical protein
MRPAGAGLSRAMLLAAAVLTAAGCALDMPKKAAETEAEAVPRPEWRVGDRWVFKRTTLTGASVVVTHQIMAATVEGYTVEVLGLAAPVIRQWTSDVHLVLEKLGDGPTVRYELPASYFAWPIKPGGTWTQEFQYTDGRNDDRYITTWKIGETVEPIDTVAGRFYTLRVERRSGTQRLETSWYTLRVRYWIRREDYLRGYVEELVEFRSWGS